MRSGSPWPAADAQLRTLWDDGHSTVEIGQRIGVSKNAVIGRVHRLGLKPRPSPIIRGGEPTPLLPRRVRERPTLPPLPSVAAPVPVASAPVPVPARAPAPVAPKAAPPPAAPKPPPVPAASLITARCVWPTWVEKDDAYWRKLFAGAAPSCGAPVRMKRIEGGWVPCRYCAAHAAKAFAKKAFGYATDTTLAALAAHPPEPRGPGKVRAYV